MKKIVKKVEKKAEKKAVVKEVEAPVCVKPEKVLIEEVNTDLGRGDLNALASKLNEVIKTLNTL
jgi:hypothetical protein